MTEPQASPRDYVLYADSYFYAAAALYHIEREADGEKVHGLDPHMLLPGLMLLCHSIELSLKGFLLRRSHDADSLRKVFGHKLENLFEDALESGLVSHDATLDSDDTREDVRYLDGVFRSLKVRYPLKSHGFDGRPELLELARRILLACADACDAAEVLCTRATGNAPSPTSTPSTSFETSGAGLLDRMDGSVRKNDAPTGDAENRA